MKKSLHLHVFEDLFSKIKSNYYKLGDKLPTEMEMQEIYQMSRAPIRQALGKLQVEGLIERKAGIGSIVVESPGNGPWLPMGGFSLKFSEKWTNLKCNTIEVLQVIPEEKILNSLQLNTNSPVVRITRIRNEGDEPIFLLKHYYPGVDTQKFEGAGDILFMRQFASEVLGIEFSYVTEEIVAVTADSQLSYYLNVTKGHPLISVKRISYDSDFKPVEYVDYFVKTENWPYKISFQSYEDEQDM